jgi:Flp pilus assembly protein TadG
VRSRFRVESAGRERGSVTAEFAVVLPAVVMVLVVALSGLQVAGQQLRLQSATVDAARLLARGDGGASSLVSRAVRGAQLTQSTRGDLVCVEARAPTSVGVLFALTISASACQLSELRP